MSSIPKQSFSPGEYLAIERQAETKSEYFQGEMFAMSGASREHILIAGNVSRESGNQLRDRPCEVYQSDMRVKVSASGLYTYPDVAIVCGEPKFEDAEIDTLLNPTVLVEVLSASMEDDDHGKKFEHYRKVDSLKDYVLIGQDKYHVENFSRQADGRWVLWETDDFNETLLLESIDCKLTLAEIYARVTIERS